MTGFSELNNEYLAMRHGLSVPNTKGIIVSHRENGTSPEYGLVDEGIDQARKSSQVADLPENTVVVTSPFSRAYQTAEILYRVANADDFIIDERLRERYFGDMEFESADRYKEVWARDYVNADHTYKGVEPVEQVAERGLNVLSDLEQKFAGRVIVLVSHADTINILRAAVQGVDIRNHRMDFYIKNSEVQPLIAAE